jgi:hypothetical protein
METMMKKLRLGLDDLRVDTFDTTAPRKEKGTVFGEQCTCWTQCGQDTCPGCPTCGDTCPNTCAYSCDDFSCAWTCAGNTCEVYTCDRQYCYMSEKYTNCNNICY